MKKLSQSPSLKLLFLPALAILLSVLFINDSSRSGDIKEMSCPERCDDSKEACEQDCSQLVGGGAKSKERRECRKECGSEFESCDYRCQHPTPKPTLKPERYYDRECTKACELKQKDCNTVCTKYTGGGAKGGKKALCRDECSERADYCLKRCSDPSLPERTERFKKPELSCGEDCGYKFQHCESGCSVYIGGGAKSEKRARCVSQCQDRFEACSGSCTE